MAQTYKIIPFKTFNVNTEEYKKQNAIIDNIDKIAQLLQKNAGYCEYIESKEVCKLFGDIDFDDEKPEHIINDYAEIVINELNNIYKLNLNLEDFKYTVNNGKKNKENKKCSSYHWVIPKISLVKREQRDLLNYIFDKNKSLMEEKNLFINEFFDTKVYGNLIFRLPNQKKENKEGTEHKIIKGDLKDFVLSYVEGSQIKEFIKKEEKKSKEVKEVKEIKFLENKDNNENLTLIKKCLNTFTVHRFENYDYWFKIGCIIFKELGEKGFNLFDEVSKRASNYDASSVENTWFQISSRNKYDLSTGTLVMWAREDNPEFCANEEEEHYKTNKKINYEKINNIYKNALYEKNDRNTADLINYLYPNYFVSNGKTLYFFNQYGLYRKDESGFYLNKIFEGVIKHLQNMIFNINLFNDLKINDNMNEDERKETDKKKKERITHIKDLIKSFSMVKHIKDIKSMLTTKNIVQKLDEKLDETNKDLIGFENGVYDLTIKKFRKGNPEDYISMSTGYEYFEESEENKNRVLQILASLWDTPDKAEYFLNKIAYSLTGNKTKQEINIHSGLGGNGKSLTFDFMRHCLGEYFGIMNPEYFTTYEKDANRANPELAGTKGKRIILVNEPAENSKLQVQKLKSISGNEKIITRHLRADPIEFYPQFMLHILTNDIPQLSKVDGGIQRRLKIIEYPFIFKSKEEYIENQPNIKLADSNLLLEIPKLKMAFFEVLAHYFKREYIEIDEVKQATNEYIEDNNKFIQWFNINYTITKNNLDCIRIKDIVEEYLYDEKEKVTTQSVNKRLQQLGLEKARKITSGPNKDLFGIYGITRKVQETEQIQEDPFNEDSKTIY